MERPRDERGRFVSRYRDVKLFEVTVWDITNGDIVEKLWRASNAELDEVEEKYRDWPFIEVQSEWLPNV